MFRLQGCSSLKSYVKTLVTISAHFGKLSEGSSISQVVEGSIMLYLMSLHPRQFAVVGNMALSEEEEHIMTFIWGSVTYGDAKPLFGNRTTNGVEGENNAFLYNNLRHQTVRQAIITFMERCQQARESTTTLVDKCVQQGVTVCTRAATFLQKERKKANTNVVYECDSDRTTFNVKCITDGSSTMVSKLLENHMTCTSCIVREQLCLPCSHIISVLGHLKRQRENIGSLLDLVHPGYKYDINMQNCLAAMRFVVPPTYDILKPHSATIVKPPPRYNRRGDEDLQPTKSGRRQTRRFASVGEFERGGKVSRTRVSQQQVITDSVSMACSSNSASAVSTDHDNFSEVFESIVGPPSKKRRAYKCQKCGGTGHNSSTCRWYDDSTQSKHLESGEYIIGSDPADRCCVDREIYLEYGSRSHRTAGTTVDEVQQNVNQILAFTLFLGFDQFQSTLNDLMQFCTGTALRADIISVIAKAVDDPQCVEFISSRQGVLLQYLMQYCINDDADAAESPGVNVENQYSTSDDSDTSDSPEYVDFGMQFYSSDNGEALDSRQNVNVETEQYNNSENETLDSPENQNVGMQYFTQNNCASPVADVDDGPEQYNNSENETLDSPEVGMQYFTQNNCASPVADVDDGRINFSCFKPEAIRRLVQANDDLQRMRGMKLGGSRAKPSQKAMEMVVSKVGSVVLTLHDLMCLRDKQWVNDSVIDAFSLLFS